MKNITDRSNVNASGVMYVWRAAYRAPARPASPPLKVNVTSFRRTTGTPIASAATSASRTATRPRPKLLIAMLRST